MTNKAEKPQDDKHTAQLKRLRAKVQDYSADLDHSREMTSRLRSRRDELATNFEVNADEFDKSADVMGSCRDYNLREQFKGRAWALRQAAERLRRHVVS
jgi:hypothetical protein